MARGGKRAGAGRKAQGITRKVSLTLTAEEWAQIEASGKTVAAFLRELMQQPKQSDVMVAYWKEEAKRYQQEMLKEVERAARLEYKLEKSNANQKVERLTRRDVEQLWMICSEKYSDKPAEALEEAKDALFRNLFRPDDDLTDIKTQPQYVCPFTGKRFGTPSNLVRTAIPRLISSAETNLKNRQAAEERRRAKEDSERHWQQLIDEGKLPAF